MVDRCRRRVLAYVRARIDVLEAFLIDYRAKFLGMEIGKWFYGSKS
jgi:hypothetical protein